MATLYCTTNPTHARRPHLATLGCLHPEVRCIRTLLTGPVAIAAIASRTRQIAGVRLSYGHLGGWRLDYQRCPYGLRFDAVVDVGSANDGSQRHAVGVTGYVDGSTTLTAIHRRRPGVFTPFCDGFLEPSRRI